MTSDDYDPYGLAWRFLGAYIDCSANNDDSSGCQRILLWAGYRNIEYHGNAIGEYAFYDWRTKSWDTSTCINPDEECTPLDCHLVDPNHFELVGVYKEVYGLYDWAEQLFKHQAYCVWEEDQSDNQQGSSSNNNGQNNFYYESSSNYEFMQSMLEDWPDGCNQLDDDESLYVDTMPLKGGNLVHGIYTDSSCQNPYQHEASYLSYSKYLLQKGGGHDNENNPNRKQADALEAAWERWNDLLNDVKVCQPCRAYSRVPFYQDDDGGNRVRRLEDNYYDQGGDDDNGEYQEDGNGDEEPNGFDCYDDAGYRNCNQCYKFESKTDMEEASTEDLELASSQGTILAVVVDGIKYGEGRGNIDSFATTVQGGFRLGESGKLALKITGCILFFLLVLWMCLRCRARAIRRLKAKAARKRGGFFQRVFSWGKKNKANKQKPLLGG